MKKYIALVLAITMYAESFANSADGLVLGSGVPVFLKLSESWTTKSKLCPQFVVANNVTDSKGNILIYANTTVESNCEIKRAKGVGRGGLLKLNFVSTTAIDGQRVALYGKVEAEGDDRKGLVHGLTWPMFFLVLGPLALPLLAIKGKQAKLSANYQVVANTVGYVQIRN